MQTQWWLESFAKCSELGLSTHWEAGIRKAIPDAEGLLVSLVVIPEGPGDSKLQTGDVLIKVNGVFLVKFVEMDAILDSDVHRTLDILIQRHGQEIELQIEVQDSA